MWVELSYQDASTSTANMLEAFSSRLINTWHAPKKDIGDYLVELEVSLKKVCSIGLLVAEEIQVAVLLISFMNEESIFRTVAELKTMNDAICTSEKVAGWLTERQLFE